MRTWKVWRNGEIEPDTNKAGVANTGGAGAGVGSPSYPYRSEQVATASSGANGGASLADALSGWRKVAALQPPTGTYWNRPTAPSKNMTSRELADYQAGFTRYARGRLLTVGAEQYSTAAGQQFESMPLDKLLSETLDELADIVNYAAMTAIRIERIREAING